MGFEVRCIDHQTPRRFAFGSQRDEYPLEHAHARPAYEPVIQGFMRPIHIRGIAPAEPVSDHMNDPADDPAVINPRHPV